MENLFSFMPQRLIYSQPDAEKLKVVSEKQIESVEQVQKNLNEEIEKNKMAAEKLEKQLKKNLKEGVDFGETLITAKAVTDVKRNTWSEEKNKALKENKLASKEWQEREKILNQEIRAFYEAQINLEAQIKNNKKQTDFLGKQLEEHKSLQEEYYAEVERLKEKAKKQEEKLEKEIKEKESKEKGEKPVEKTEEEKQPKKEEEAEKQKEEKPLEEKVKEAAEKEKKAIAEEYDKRITLLKKKLEEYREQYKEQPEKFAELEKRTNSVIELYEKGKSEAEPKWLVDHKAGPRLSASGAVNEHFRLAISEFFGKEEGEKAIEKAKKEAAEEKERLAQEKLKETFDEKFDLDITFEVGHTFYGDVMAKLGPDKNLKKTDKAEFDKLVKETNAKSNMLVSALFKAGVNPNMFNKGDRLRVKNGVLYLDRMRGEVKNQAIKLHNEASVQKLTEKFMDAQGVEQTKEMEYIDITTPEGIKKEIAKAHQRIEKPADTFKRGVLFDILSQWKIPHKFETRNGIWVKMGKDVAKEPYKGSLEQNMKMSEWLRSQKAEGLKKLAEEYKPVKKTEVAAPEVKKDAPPEVKKDASPEVKKDAAPEVKKDAAPEVKKDAPPEEKKDAPPEVKKDASPENK